ncbi:MAG: hypothetical protein SGARI_005733, partial [Bacillariaceae sp.]
MAKTNTQPGTMSTKKKAKQAGKAKKKKGPASPWMKVIQQAVVVVLENNKTVRNTKMDNQTKENGKPTVTVEQIDHSLAFLNTLSTILHQNDMEWPPMSAPPSFEEFSIKKSAPATTTPNNRGGSVHNGVTEKSHIPTNSVLSNRKSPAPQASVGQMNSFESLALSDDDDDSDYEDEEEAGDVLVSNTLSPSAMPFVPTELDTLRLLIRLFTSQADLYSRKARLLAMSRQWMTGANALQSAILALQQAMGLADTEISKYLMQEVADSGFFFTSISIETDSSRRKHQLEQDAEIVHVSAHSLTEDRNQYLRLAEKQLNRLKKILEPTWKSRQIAKEHMGETWYKNPNGKHHYAKSTAKYEKELKMLEETIDLLSTEEAEILSVTAKHLKEKLQALWYQKSRYNGKEIKQNVPRL